MKKQNVMVIYLQALTLLFVICTESLKLNRSSFPAGFLFGAGSSAYQYEGAANSDGKSPSIWDTFVIQYPEKIADHSTGNIADEFYYLHKEDIALMKEMGLDSFRLSISWPRVLPRGKLSGGVNWEGVKFYNKIINELLSNDIEPFVTLFHWDLPQALEDEYGGFLSPMIVIDFQDYADLCFQQFGDRVKYWITLNEPNLFSEFGYARGVHAPGRCSNYIGNCTQGNSATEPYLVTHHLILTHATAFELYRNKYQATQKGIIGITISVMWQVPKYQTVSCRKAAFRHLDFQFGWIVHPTTFGDYPKTMRDLVGNRLPKFTGEQSNLVKGSLDFVGVNYYTSRYAEESNSTSTLLSYTTDSRVLETGMADANNSSLSVEEALNNNMRITYHQLHLSYLLQAIKKGGDVRGYSVWSFLDDFEWAAGYTSRFGFTFVDYKNWLKRYPKNSALWFKDFLLKENVTSTDSSLLFIQ